MRRCKISFFGSVSRAAPHCRSAKRVCSSIAKRARGRSPTRSCAGYRSASSRRSANSSPFAIARCRTAKVVAWITYWQGKSGWALVAIARDPGAATAIHAHPHRLLGKAIEGALEELRFREVAPGELELASRSVLGHEELVEADGLSALHVVRAVGRRAAIDLQLRGPELGGPGRLLITNPPVDVLTLAIGARLRVTEESDPRPGHGGEGASVGRMPDAGAA